jgi:hypothetical protein
VRKLHQEDTVLIIDLDDADRQVRLVPEDGQEVVFYQKPLATASDVTPPAGPLAPAPATPSSPTPPSPTPDVSPPTQGFVPPTIATETSAHALGTATPGLFTSVAFSPDGTKMLTGSTDGTGQIWNVPAPLSGTAEQVAVWAQLVTGIELNDVGTVSYLTSDEWLQRRQRLKKLGGPPR